MTRRTIVLLAIVWLFATATAGAADFGIGIRAGTQGFGLEGAAGFTERFAVRGGVYGYDLSRDFEEGGIDYDGELQLGGYGILVDFFPMRGKFRLSAGLFSNENEILIEATPTADIDIGGTTYTPAEAGFLSGTIGFDSTAPYAGIGWGNFTKGGRVGFLFDFGVLAQGSGDVTLSSNSSLVDPADLALEIAEIEDDIDGFDLWPVISFGLAIRF